MASFGGGRIGSAATFADGFLSAEFCCCCGSVCCCCAFLQERRTSPRVWRAIISSSSVAAVAAAEAGWQYANTIRRTPIANHHFASDPLCRPEWKISCYRCWGADTVYEILLYTKTLHTIVAAIHLHTEKEQRTEWRRRKENELFYRYCLAPFCELAVIPYRSAVLSPSKGNPAGHFMSRRTPFLGPRSRSIPWWRS